MADLRTEYLGLALRNPLVLSACPLSEDLGTLEQLRDAGIAAVVLRSLFEEQIEREALELHGLLDEWSDSYVEAQSYFPQLPQVQTGPEVYLRLLENAKRRLDIPVIASLNGSSPGGWTRYARYIEEAGADALELNVYRVEVDPAVSGAEVEAGYLEIIAAVRAVVAIPLAVKIGPFFSSLPHFAREAVAAGADGLVLFNRFLQPDIDIDEMRVEPAMRLSTPDELRLPLRWVAILRGTVQRSLALTGGVHGGIDALKAVAAGADAVMMASALLQEGPALVGAALQAMDGWLARNEYESIAQLKGCMSQASAPDAGAFERAQYVRAVSSYTPARPPRASRHGESPVAGPR